MTIESLLAPVSPEQPCGENLEYDADFQAMEQASLGKAEQQFGSTIIPAEPADWTRVEKLATGLLARTKDIRVMMALTHAWTRRRGLEGYADGLMLLGQALALYWDQLWPSLTDGGEFDPFYRINALAGLSDKSALTTTLRQAPLLRSNGDELNVRDAQALLDGSKTECAGYPGGRVRLIDELTRGGQPGIEAIGQIEGRLQTIRTWLLEQLGESGVPEMEQLLKTVGLIAGVSRASRSEEQQISEPTASTDNAPQPVVAAPLAAHTDWRTAQVTTRADAQLMLEKVKQYFTQHEPSHPAPLMIDRVQRLIELDFMEIIRDLAPDGVNQLQNIFGRQD
ncbi:MULTISPECIES: type VI secretion system protein TssA [Kosakonia]|uniref:Type VI secretion system protein TssA n=1 Tax=Kosakonia quasisacchari TaxID=2529380 RepID=A0A4R0HAE9_9ENTR|nr:type VI secretion system protein TssA [Kosakonia quasisacchari]TCC07103.1 type VI secretion system protein TssA [Kosakonia quasisacchari]